MIDDDISAELERELEDLDVDDDGLETSSLDEAFLARFSADQDNVLRLPHMTIAQSGDSGASSLEDQNSHLSINKELETLLESANNLGFLVETGQTRCEDEINIMLDVHNSGEGDDNNSSSGLKEDPRVIFGSTSHQEHIELGESGLESRREILNHNSAASTELSALDRLIVHDVLCLMVESVERVAPICTFHKGDGVNDKLSKDLSSEGLVVSDIIVPEVIEDDSQIVLVESGYAAEHGNDKLGSSCGGPADEVSHLLHETMRLDVEKFKESQKTSLRQHDLVMWEESKEFKEAIEQDKLRRMERQRKREQEKITALHTRLVGTLQKIYRGYVSRKSTNVLIKAHRDEQAAARAAQDALERAKLEEEKRLKEMELSKQEQQRMQRAEDDSRSVWLALRRREDQLRGAEQLQLQEEDNFATTWRDEQRTRDFFETRFQELRQEADEEYPDLGFDDDDDDDDDEISSDCGGADETRYIPKQNNMLVVQDAVPPPRPSVPAGSETTNEQRSPRLRKGLEMSKVSVLPMAPKLSFGGSFKAGSVHSSESSAPAESLNRRQEIIEIPAVTDTLAESIISIARSNNLSPQDVFGAPLIQHWDQLSRLAHLCANTDNILSSEGVRKAAIVTAESQTSSHLENEDRGEDLYNLGSGSTAPIIRALNEWQRLTLQRCVEASVTRQPVSQSGGVGRNDSSAAVTGLVGQASPPSDNTALNNSMLDLATDPLMAKELDLCVEGISETHFLARYRNLTKLVVNVNKISRFTGISGLSSLVTLSAKDNKLSTLDAIASLKSLRYLYVDSNKLNDLSSLNGLGELRVLTANSNLITKMPVLSLANLQRLELFRNKISSVGVADSHCLSGVPLLTHLDLGSNSITAANGDALSACGLLQTLILSQNLLTEVPSPLHLPLLKNLWLNGNQITSLGPWTSGVLPRHSPDLDHAPQSQASEHASWPLFLPSLQKLIIRDNQITQIARGMMEMTPLLIELDVSFNALVARQEVASIRYCSYLTSFHCQDNHFTTVPVNTATGTSTTRVPFPETEQLVLNQWLMGLCPTLEIICGNRVDRNDLAKVPTQEQRANEYIIDIENQFSHPGMRSNDCSLFHRLIHTLQHMNIAQLAASSREKIVKRVKSTASKSSKAAVVSHHGHSTANSTPIDIDLEANFVNLLAEHKRILSSLFRDVSAQSVDRLPLVSFTTADEVSHLDRSANDAITKNMTMGIAFEAQEDNDGADLLTSDWVSRLVCPSVTSTPTNIQHALVDDQAGNVDTGGHTVTTTCRRVFQLPLKVVVLLQSRCRGMRARRRIGEALKSIRYADNELDDLFGSGMEGEEFDFEKEMSELSQFLAADGESTSTAAPLVYGDHIRKRSRQQPQGNSSFEYVDPVDVVVTGTAESVTPAAAAAAGSGWVLPQGAPSPTTGGAKQLPSTVVVGNPAANEKMNEYASRPSTGMSSLSAASAQTDHSYRPSIDTTYQHENQDHHHQQHNLTSPSEFSTPSNSSKRVDSLAQEWGISDPKVLAAMMKRNQRMKGFASAKETRAQAKDPLARLERFRKTAHRSGNSGHSTVGNTATSGSFGGKPKTVRTGAGNGKQQRRHMSVPAWMVGSEEGEGENA